MRWAAFFLLSLSAQAATEADVRALLRAATGVVSLPPGTIEIAAPLDLPEQAHGLTVAGAPEGTVLMRRPVFTGVLSSWRARLTDCTAFVHHRWQSRVTRSARRATALRYSVRALHSPTNGILVEDSDTVAIESIEARQMSGFAFW